MGKEDVAHAYSGILCVHVCMCSVAQSSLCDPVDYSPPGSSVHGVSQARILEWVAISSSKGSNQPKDQTPVSAALLADSLRYSASQRSKAGSFVETWVNLASVMQGEESQKEKNRCYILMYICGI